jgi:hypothetical protein
MEDPKNAARPTVVLNKDYDEFLDFNSSYDLAEVMKALNKIIDTK